MIKIFFISLACVALADEMKQEPVTRTSRGIIFGSSGSDGGFSTSFYGKSDGLRYSLDPGQHGSSRGLDYGNKFGLKGIYPVYSLGDSNIRSHNFVGQTHNEYSNEEPRHEGLSLASISGHHFDLGGSDFINKHNNVGGHYETSYEESENKEHEGGYEGSHKGGYEGSHEASDISLNIHREPHVHETTKPVPVHETLKIPVHHPVHQAINIPIPFKVAVPYAIKIPIPVQVEKTVNVPVEKIIPFPVEKPIPFKVVKKIPVPVSKPYPVPYPVYKVRYVYHTKKIHHGHNHHHDYHGHHY